jgi:tripartite-type tricarboxylate transporter receptor subunit TctC
MVQKHLGEASMIRSFSLVTIALLSLATLCSSQSAVQAQDWPQRNVRLILPFGAGSATDSAARLLGERLSTRWGKAVVVENRPGGDGLVAINAFISAADDHVLLYASSASFMAHPYTQERVPYDLERDLQPIARVSHTVLSIGVPAATEFKTIADFVAGARAAPDKYNVAGAAGVPEFTLDAFVKTQNLKVTKVPYRDVVQAGRDLGENRIQFLVSSYAVVRPLIEANKVRVVALGGRQRSKVVPEVPSVVGISRTRDRNHVRLLWSGRDAAGFAQAHRPGRDRGGERCHDLTAHRGSRPGHGSGRPRGTGTDIEAAGGASRRGGQGARPAAQELNYRPQSGMRSG